MKDLGDSSPSCARQTVSRGRSRVADDSYHAFVPWNLTFCTTAPEGLGAAACYWLASDKKSTESTNNNDVLAVRTVV